jgi:hypothetical protein
VLMHVAHDGCNLPICTHVRYNQYNTTIRNSAGYQSEISGPLSPMADLPSSSAPANETPINPLDSDPQTPIQPRPTMPRDPPTPTSSDNLNLDALAAQLPNLPLTGAMASIPPTFQPPSPSIFNVHIGTHINFTVSTNGANFSH